ncbi:MAG TPA: DUF5654 family protein [Ktedonobacterales bacterium]|jgi:hypothetical protein
MSDYSENPNLQGTYAQPSGADTPAHGRRLMGGIDPRKALDPATVERMIHTQLAARAQAQAATTMVLATIVSLITAAFSFVAALAWNSAIQELLKENVKLNSTFLGIKISDGGVEAIYAVIVTVIAVVVVVFLNRIAKRVANKSAFDKS